MNEEMIRRSDAIKALDANFTIKGKENMQTVLNYLELVRTRIEGAPTIEPKRGEWIDEADKYDASFGIHDYRCSNCNSYADEYIGGHEWYTMYKPNYCPYCGADMRDEDDE